MNFSLTHLFDNSWFENLPRFSSRAELPCLFSGLSDPAKALYAGAIGEKTGKKCVIITKDEASALKLIGDITSLFGEEKAVFIPARDLSFRSEDFLSREYELTRLSAFSKIISKNYSVALLSAESLMGPAIPPEVFSENSFELKVGDEIDLKDIISRLIKGGYSRKPIVDGTSEFSCRGGIIDIFPTGSSFPVRIELFGDEIDTISAFSTESQRREERLEKITITPSREVIYSPNELIGLLEENNLSPIDIETLKSGEMLGSADKYIPLLYKNSSIFQYFEDSIFFLSEPSEVLDAASASYKIALLDIEASLKAGETPLNTLFLSPEVLVKTLEEKPLYLLDSFIRKSGEIPVRTIVSSETKTIPRLPRLYSELKEELSDYLSSSVTPIIYSGTEKSVSSLVAFLNKEGLRAEAFKGEIIKGIVYVAAGSLSMSFILPREGIAFLGVTGAEDNSPRRKKLFKKGKEISSLDDLTIGETVVHSAHGIGVFAGIQKIKRDNIEKDYIKIKYAGADVLYVPVSGLDLVSKYIGPGEGEKVKLNKLSGVEWQNQKTRVKKELQEMADELITLYKKRLETKGFPFGPDSDWQREFEERFDYEETDDQLRCVREIKADMEKPSPMDRLLTGDVGFGKTEVALRAAFKCVLESKQVALLAPTTILAYQHYETAKKRFDGYPITVELLSRFRTPKEQKEIIKRLSEGKIDILIGTHRIIGPDVLFPDLGLLIVDEEQRFGVRHKEKLKEKFIGVDVLTLSATPIPRTLNMALSGIRDMSMIEQPPRDRKPVQTFVVEEDEGIIADAIRKEIRRGGSVFYLHNRVESILSAASRIERLVPEARIGIAHGKMDEDDLSAVFSSLISGEIDVLVTTTIIETGIDIPSANTLIIEDADRMGLSQLYQIRGRVGRSPRRAYAYFMFKPQKVLSEIASKRLTAIRDFTQFGSGFKIAMRDLEIRGAGSILGARQHGHMENVGYDMYMKLLRQTVMEKQGEKPAPETADCLVDLKMSAFIPEDYISENGIRMFVYKRIAGIETYEDKLEVIDELIDRFGEPPKEVIGLIDVAFYRKKAILFGCSEIKETADSVLFYLNQIDMEKISPLIGIFGRRLLLNAGTKPYIAIKTEGKSGLSVIKELLEKT